MFGKFLYTILISTAGVLVGCSSHPIDRGVELHGIPDIIYEKFGSDGRFQTYEQHTRGDYRWTKHSRLIFYYLEEKKYVDIINEESGVIGDAQINMLRETASRLP